MRIVTWNCCGNLLKGIAQLNALQFDVAVIPECLRQDIDELERTKGYHCLWVGPEGRRGLGVLAGGEFQLKKLAEPNVEWIVPIEVAGDRSFQLIAVWTVPVKGSYRAYLRQLWTAFEENGAWFDDKSTVLAGDFNSSSRFDLQVGTRNHTDLVRDLRAKGLKSAYHAYFSEEHGGESRHTFHLYRHRDKTYHLEYIFLPVDWMNSVESVVIGSPDVWLELSDHLPLLVELYAPSCE